MNLGEVIRAVRVRLNMTQQQVCDSANIAQGYYSSIENGATPSIEKLERIANTFELPVFILISMATNKQDVPQNKRGWFRKIKPVLDNIIEEAITTTQ